MSGQIVAEAMLLTAQWGLRYRLGQVKDGTERLGAAAGQAAQEAGRKVGRLRGQVTKWWQQRGQGGTT